MIRVVALLVSWVLRIWLGSLTYPHPSVGDRRSRRAQRMPAGDLPVLARDAAAAHACARAARVFRARQPPRRRRADRAGRAHARRAGRARVDEQARAQSALRGMMRTGRLQHLAITPDGPRGPRRVMQPGAIYLGQQDGHAADPRRGWRCGDCWRHRSWDRMALPKPGTVARRSCSGEPVRRPGGPGPRRPRPRACAGTSGAGMACASVRPNRWLPTRRAPVGRASGDVRPRKRIDGIDLDPHPPMRLICSLPWPRVDVGLEADAVGHRLRRGASRAA